MRQKRAVRTFYGSILLMAVLLAGALQCRESRTKELIRVFESEKRQEWQKPDLVLSQMGDLKGKRVADLGAGSGYFTFRLAPVSGRVIAVDVDEGFLDHLRMRKAELEKSDPASASRLEIRTTVPDSPGLAVGEVDAVLMVNVYHHLPSSPVVRMAYMKQVKEALNRGGTLYLIDWKEGDRPVGPPPGHALIPRETMIRELEETGFHVESVEGILPYQNFLMARPVGKGYEP